MSSELFDLDIELDEGMSRQAAVIALPKVLREKLGVISGQQIQFAVAGADLLLKVIDCEGEVAKASPSVFYLLTKGPLRYSIPPITLGCDPEFFIFNGRQFLSAATYLPFVGQVGCDGGLGELRPTYGMHENQVVANLRDLIHQIPHRMIRQKWAVGLPSDGHKLSYQAHSYFNGLSAGFHVHLGLPTEMLNTKREFHRKAMEHLVKCLDWYVGTLLVPLEPDLNRRCGRSNYGLPGDYRTSNVTLEYRTPGAFYLRNPTLAGGLMGTCLMVAENFVRKVREASQNFVKLDRLTSQEFQELLPIPRPEVVRFTLMDEKKELAFQALPRVLANLREMPEYLEHQSSVEEFAREVGAGTQPSPSLTDNWRS